MKAVSAPCAVNGLDKSRRAERYCARVGLAMWRVSQSLKLWANTEAETSLRRKRPCGTKETSPGANADVSGYTAAPARNRTATARTAAALSKIAVEKLLNAAMWNRATANAPLSLGHTAPVAVSAKQLAWGSPARPITTNASTAMEKKTTVTHTALAPFIYMTTLAHPPKNEHTPWG